MKLYFRSLLLVLALYGLVFAVGDAYLARRGAPVWVALAFAVVIVGLQYGVGPYLIGWFLKIRWDDLGTELPVRNREFLLKVCGDRDGRDDCSRRRRHERAGELSNCKPSHALLCAGVDSERLVGSVRPPFRGSRGDYSMKLYFRSLLLILALYGLVFAVGDAYLARHGAPVWVAMAFAVVMIGLQYGVGPYLIGWFLKIR